MRAIVRLPFVLLILLSSTSRGENFDNWYFDFFREAVDSKGTVYNAAGVEAETLRAEVSGTETKDGAIFQQKSRITYARAGETVTATIDWTRKDASTFEGLYRDSKGTEATYTLTLKDGQRFESVSDGPNGARMFSVGRINKEGQFITKSRILDAQKRTLLRMTEVMTQTPGKPDANEAPEDKDKAPAAE